MITNKQHILGHRRISFVAGTLYLLTFISIPTVALYSEAKQPGFLVNASSTMPVLVGGILETIVAIAGIGTAIALYSILKKQNESLALGLLASRTLEAAGIIAGVASLLTLVALKDKGVGADGLIVGDMLVAFYNRIFLLSQSLMPGFNDLILGYLLYKSNLVPKLMAVIGIIGGPLLIAGFLAVALGAAKQNGTIAALSALLPALFEISLGLWLVFRGFNIKAVRDLDAKKSYAVAKS